MSTTGSSLANQPDRLCYPATPWRSVSGQHPGGLYALQFGERRQRTLWVERKGRRPGPALAGQHVAGGHGVANEQCVH